jgi:hypothetical protein
MAYTKYSLTPANNTAAPPDGAPEGMLPSAVNDTMRDMMAQIRDCGDGVRDGTYTMTAVKITGGTINGATIGATTATTGKFTAVTNSALTSGRVTYAGASGLLQDSANLVFDGTNVGIGVTPSAWGGSGQVALQIGTGTSGTANFAGGGTKTLISSNQYYNGSVNKYINNGYAQAMVLDTDSSFSWIQAASGTAGNTASFFTKMTLDASGNLGIGTSSPNRLLSLYATQPVFQITNVASGNTQGTIQYQESGATNFILDNQGSGSGGAIVFQQAGSERMRIASSGNLLVGTTSQFPSATSRLAIGYNVADFVTTMQNSNANPFGMYIKYSGAAPNGVSNEFIYCHDGTLRFSVMSNGGISNYSANNSNLSDEREKKNIELAPNYLDKICQIPIKTFLYNDQTDTDLNLGVIAQDVEAICPELIMESNWGSKEEPKIRKSIYQTDLQYALMKCIQEQQALIESLTTRLTALENK